MMSTEVHCERRTGSNCIDTENVEKIGSRTPVLRAVELRCLFQGELQGLAILAGLRQQKYSCRESGVLE